MTLSRDEEVQAVQLQRKYCGSDVDVVATSVIATIINRSSLVVPALQRGTSHHHRCFRQPRNTALLDHRDSQRWSRLSKPPLTLQSADSDDAVTWKTQSGTVSRQRHGKHTIFDFFFVADAAQVQHPCNFVT